MLVTGEQPGIGIFSCIKCFNKVTLVDHDDRLPPCPKCRGVLFRRV